MSVKNTKAGDLLLPAIVEQIEAAPFAELLDERYMNYTFYVMEDRAIPDVRDGLKPSQRRVLYGMKTLGLSATSATMKCAKVTGHVSGTFHPHGDMVVYPTLYRMTQDWLARYPLVKGQGNLGALGGDPPAAQRYTECKMTRFGDAVLDDVSDSIVPFQPNYNEETTEPMVLPSRFPNLLCNGASGIAVGVATNIPPHNLREVAAAIRAYIEHDGKLTVDDLLQVMPGPDFATGGTLRGQDEVRAYYETGHGSLEIDGIYEIEVDKRGRQTIAITGLPHGASPERLSEQVEALVKEQKIKGIEDMKDLSYGLNKKTHVRVEIYLQKSANVNLVLNLLLKHTCLRTSFRVNTTVLLGGRVVENAPLLSLLGAFVDHRLQVVTNRFQAEKKKIGDRLHIVEGLLMVAANIDSAIKIIRASESPEMAVKALIAADMVKTELQAAAVLAITLSRLTRLETSKLEDEQKTGAERHQWLESMLASENHILRYIAKETNDLAKQVGDDRRTQIGQTSRDITEADLIDEEQIVISLTKDGYIKRAPVATYRVQGRGGKGVQGVQKRDSDEAVDFFVASTHELLLFFTNQGRMYKKKGYEIPETGRAAKGTHLANVLKLKPGETVNTTIPIKELDQPGFLVMVTRAGVVKRSLIRDYQTVLKEDGLKAIVLNDGDELMWVEVTDGTRDLFIVTSEGWAVRYAETIVPLYGRNAKGVKAINLQSGDTIAQMLSFNKDDNPTILVVTEKGFGKRTPADSYRCLQGRNAKGAKTIDQVKKDRNGLIVGAAIVTPDDTLFVLTAKGKVIQMPAGDIRSAGRATMGVKVVDLDNGDSVRAITRLINGMAELENEETEESSEA